LDLDELLRDVGHEDYAIKKDSLDVQVEDTQPVLTEIDESKKIQPEDEITNYNISIQDNVVQVSNEEGTYNLNLNVTKSELKLFEDIPEDYLIKPTL